MTLQLFVFRNIVKIHSLIQSVLGSGNRLVILTYHRVLPEPDSLISDEMYLACFEQQMELLANCFNVLPLSEAVEKLKTGTLPNRSVCITFDDGYENNHSVALPVLKKLNLPATVFVASGFLDTGMMWNDMIIETVRRAEGDQLDLTSVGLERYDISEVEARKITLNKLVESIKYLPLQDRLNKAREVKELLNIALPKNVMMNQAQVRDLPQNSVEVGGHTVNHPILATLDNEEATEEISLNQNKLADITGSGVQLFAYPNGKPNKDYTSAHVKLITELNYIAAVTTTFGAASQQSDVMQLPRVSPWTQSLASFVSFILSAFRYGDPLKHAAK